MDPLGLEGGRPRPGRTRCVLGTAGVTVTVAAASTGRAFRPAVLAGIGGSSPGAVPAVVAPARLAVPPAPIAVLAPLAVAGPLAVAAVVAPTVPAVAAPITAGGPVIVGAVGPGRPGTASRHQLGGDQRAAATADQLQAVAALGPGPGREHRDDLQPVEASVGFDLQNRSNRGAVRDEVGPHLALGLACARRPPSPTAVAALAGELDLESSGHGPQSYTPSRPQRPAPSPYRRKSTLCKATLYIM